MTGKSKWRIGGLVLLLLMILAVSLAGLSCVSGLVPIGWSGGTVDDGMLYVGTQEGRLAAVGLTDESLRLTDALKSSTQSGLFGCSPMMGSGCSRSSGVAIYGAPVVFGELVYIAGYNGKIYAYNKETLALRWVYPREDYLRDEDGDVDAIVGGLTEADGVLYFAGSSGTLYALNTDTGDPVWETSITTEEKIWATPTVADGTIYIGAFDKKLYALNAADGTRKWEFTAEGAIISKPLVYEGTVYVGSFDRNFYAIDAADGTKKYQFTGGNWFWAEPVVCNGKIYAGCLDDYVYVLDARNLSKTAEYDLGSPVASSPVVIDNTVVFASQEGIISAIDADTGGLRQLASFEKQVNGPLTAYGDIVCIHTQELSLERVNVVNGALLRTIPLVASE